MLPDKCIQSGKMRSNVRYSTFGNLDDVFHYYRKFVEAAFKYINKEIYWEGKGLDEVAKEKDSGIIRLKVNPKFFRPTEVEQLMGDPTKAKTKLGWKPKVNINLRSTKYKV